MWVRSAPAVPAFVALVWQEIFDVILHGHSIIQGPGRPHDETRVGCFKFVCPPIARRLPVISREFW